MTREIPLSRGLVTLVDGEDFDWLNQWKWHAVKTSHLFYAQRSEMRNGVQRGILMHREIIRAEKGVLVDHISGDSLDNRKNNLRRCTRAGNARNCRGPIRDLPKGVYAVTRNRYRPYRAGITVAGQRIYLGNFACPNEAARAYDVAAVKHFGEFARLNFPDQHPDLQGAAR